MKKKVENSINEKVRRAYEPLYGRCLSDEEVYEIRRNLAGFMSVLLKVVHRLGGIDKVPEAKHEP